MNYELAKQLKDAGFPQDMKLGQWACKHGLDRIMEHPCSCYGDVLLYAPTLSELIETCGDKFDSLNNTHGKYAWEANADDENYKDYGNTPEEAVAKLWLELNKK